MLTSLINKEPKDFTISDSLLVGDILIAYLKEKGTEKIVLTNNERLETRDSNVVKVSSQEGLGGIDYDWESDLNEKIKSIRALSKNDLMKLIFWYQSRERK